MLLADHTACKFTHEFYSYYFRITPYSSNHLISRFLVKDRILAYNLKAKLLSQFYLAIRIYYEHQPSKPLTD